MNYWGNYHTRNVTVMPNITCKLIGFFYIFSILSKFKEFSSTLLQYVGSLNIPVLYLKLNWRKDISSDK